MRFLIETYYEIRKQVGKKFPIGLKLNSADFQRGGFTEEESMQVLQKISEVGIDLIEISGGNYENPKMFIANATERTKKREAYFLDYADKARKIISTPLVVTGGFKSEEGMKEAIDSGAIDMVGIGKAFALVPDLPNQIFRGKYETVQIKPIRTGVKWIDSKAAILEIGWYEQQLERISKGKRPNPDYSVWLSLLKNILWKMVFHCSRKEEDNSHFLLPCSLRVVSMLTFSYKRIMGNHLQHHLYDIC